jgi:hypothetical protein
MSRLCARVLVTLAATAVAALALPLAASAAAEDDDREARVRARCSTGSVASLRLRADEGRIRLELRIDTRRRAAPWSVIVLHERRIAFRGTLRTTSSGSLRLRRTLPDLYGRNAIVIRANGPGRELCRISATV